jgi:hypothetical protein
VEAGFGSGLGIPAPESRVAHGPPQRISLPPSIQPPMNVDFGVQVIRPFERSGEVFSTETPAGRVATALHIGPYTRIGEAHQAIHAWAKDNAVKFAGKSWEIYGDWSNDESTLETRIEYLLS